MKNPVAMNNDARAIREISTPGENTAYWGVGSIGITQIVPYLENGQVWFAVYKGDWLAYRVNAARVEYVWYGRPPE